MKRLLLSFSYILFCCSLPCFWPFCSADYLNLIPNFQDSICGQTRALNTLHDYILAHFQSLDHQTIINFVGDNGVGKSFIESKMKLALGDHHVLIIDGSQYRYQTASHLFDHLFDQIFNALYKNPQAIIIIDSIDAIPTKQLKEKIYRFLNGDFYVDYPNATFWGPSKVMLDKSFFIISSDYVDPDMFEKVNDEKNPLSEEQINDIEKFQFNHMYREEKFFFKITKTIPFYKVSQEGIYCLIKEHALTTTKKKRRSFGW